MQRALVDKFCGQPIKVTGDGQYDSPGFTARYCLYTIVESSSKMLLDFYVAEKTQVKNVITLKYT